MSNQVCPVCGEGVLYERQGTHNVTYLGVSGKVNFYFSECSHCKTEQAGGWQIKVNKDNVLAFHRSVDKK